MFDVLNGDIEVPAESVSNVNNLQMIRWYRRWTFSSAPGDFLELAPAKFFQPIFGFEWTLNVRVRVGWEPTKSIDFSNLGRWFFPNTEIRCSFQSDTIAEPGSRAQNVFCRPVPWVDHPPP